MPPHHAEAGRDGAPRLLGVSLKLYLDVERSVGWAWQLAELARSSTAVREGRVELFALPSLPALPGVVAALAGSGVQPGAQDLHWEDRGAFTGAVSGTDLAHLGARLVEVGHAERRAIFGEDDAIVARKVRAAVRNGLAPVLCVGEEAQGDPQLALEECRRQLDASLAEVDEVEIPHLVVAYEPVWAIGQPVAAPAEHVRHVARGIRAHLDADARIARGSVIYGGSAQRGTFTELAGDVDGLFLGRFAHDVNDLAAIVDEAAA